MFWLHYTREFYKAAANPTVNPTRETAKQTTRNTTPLYVSVLKDIPQIDTLYTRVRELEAALALSEKSRDAFLSSMSHELRTPLNAIMGFSEMMKEGVFGDLENPTYNEYAGHIHDSGEALLGKINDLLDIASMDVGGIVLEEEDILLAHLFGEAVEIHSHHAFARGQTIKTDCASNIRIHADRRKLLCALTHFISNAVRHSKNDAQIILMARIQPDDGIILSVRDEGEGIQPAQLITIRSALQKDASYRDIECGGIGLGLSLSKELASQHDGRMMIDSIRHRGTVVSMILPKERILAGMPAKRRRSL